MDTTLLRCFLAVCDARSFSIAAQRLNVSQSTISHQVARLEDLLDVELFKRTTRQCEPTREGNELLPFAARIVRLEEEMEETFKPELIRSRVVIGVPDEYYLMPAMTGALASFMIERPNVAIEMRAGLAIDSLRALRSGLLDLAVCRGVGVVAEQALRSERLIWVAGEAWSQPRDSILPLAVVGGGGGCIYRRTAIDALDGREMRWKEHFSCTSLEGVLSIVRRGMAITVLPESEMQTGMREIGQDGSLPELPLCNLTLRFAEKEPSWTARAIADRLSSALQV